MHYLKFESDGSGSAVYGYGQTIYADILFQYELLSESTMRLTFLDSPPTVTFPGFKPDNETKIRCLDYELIEHQLVTCTTIVPRNYQFKWKLILSQSPFPDGVDLPRKLLLTYHGYRQDLGPSIYAGPNTATRKWNSPLNRILRYLRLK